MYSLHKSNAVAIKRKQEIQFQQEVKKAGKEAEYGNLLSDFEKNYKEIAPYALSRDYFTEVVLRNTELLNVSFKLYQLEQVYTNKGEQAFTDRKNNLANGTNLANLLYIFGRVRMVIHYEFYRTLR